MAKKSNNRPAGGKSGAMSSTTRLFLAGACAEVYLLTVYRFYVKDSHSMLVAWYDTYLPAIMWVGLGVLLLGLVLLGIGKGKEKLLPLGKLAKAYFHPHHSLAMAGKARKQVELWNDPRLSAYLAGEEIPCEGAGWAQVTVMGCPLGWGKISQGRMKNHLPAGLRRKWQDEGGYNHE